MLGNSEVQRSAHDRRIHAYAAQLRLPRISQYPEIRPVLEEGIHCRLPEGWATVLNEAGHVMYFHAGSGACRLDHPLDDTIRRKCLEIIEQLEVLRKEQTEAARRRHTAAHHNAAITSIAREFDVLYETPQQQQHPPAPLHHHDDGRAAAEDTQAGNTNDEDTSYVDAQDDDDDPWDFVVPSPAAASPTAPIPRVLNGPTSGGGTTNMDDVSLNSIYTASSSSEAPTSSRPFSATSFMSTAMSRVTNRLMHVVDREEIMELQREVETLQRANEAIHAELALSKEVAESLAATAETIPDEFLCPITGELMQDAVVTADGFSYERAAISTWLKRHDTSPCTNKKLDHKTLIPNLALRSQIQTLMQRVKM